MYHTWILWDIAQSWSRMTWIHVNPDSTFLVCMEKTRRNSTARTTSVDAGGSDACVPRLFGAKVMSQTPCVMIDLIDRTTRNEIFMYIHVSFFCSGLKCKQKWSFNNISCAQKLSFSSYGKWTSAERVVRESSPTPDPTWSDISVVIGQAFNRVPLKCGTHTAVFQHVLVGQQISFRLPTSKHHKANPLIQMSWGNRLSD